MKRFIEGASRSQSTLFPEYLEDWVGEDNPVRVIDVFVDELDLGDLGFKRVDPKETGQVCHFRRRPYGDVSAVVRWSVHVRSGSP